MYSKLRGVWKFHRTQVLASLFTTIGCIGIWLAIPPRDRSVVEWLLLLGGCVILYLALVSEVQRCPNCNADTGRYVDPTGARGYRRRKCRYCGDTYEINAHLR